MAIRFIAISASGDELELFELGSGLIAPIDPSHTNAQPFEGSDVFKTASGQDVHQTRPGVFVVVGSDVEYERVADDATPPHIITTAD